MANCCSRCQAVGCAYKGVFGSFSSSWSLEARRITRLKPQNTGHTRLEGWNFLCYSLFTLWPHFPFSKQALTHSLLKSFDKFIGSKIFLDYLLYKIYSPLKKSRRKMSFYLIHDLSIKSLRSYPDYNWSDNFMLSCADQPGNLEQTLPQRGEPIN